MPIIRSTEVEFGIATETGMAKVRHRQNQRLKGARLHDARHTHVNELKKESKNE